MLAHSVPCKVGLDKNKQYEQTTKSTTKAATLNQLVTAAPILYGIQLPPGCFRCINLPGPRVNAQA